MSLTFIAKTRLESKLEAHFSECERLKLRFDEKIGLERRKNADLRKQIEKLQFEFETTRRSFESSVEAENKQWDEREVVELAALRADFKGELNRQEAEAREQIELEERLEEERESEMLASNGEMSRKCAAILETCLSRRDELKIMRKELEVNLISLIID